MPDIAHRGAGQPDLRRHIRHPVAQKGGIRRFQRHIGARSHRHTDICRRKGRGIVDAVTDHHHAALFGHLFDLGHFIAGHQIGAVFDPQPARNRRRCARVVACQHDRGDAKSGQLRDACNGISARFIPHGNQPQRAAVAEHHDHGFSLLL